VNLNLICRPASEASDKRSASLIHSLSFQNDPLDFSRLAGLVQGLPRPLSSSESMLSNIRSK